MVETALCDLDFWSHYAVCVRIVGTMLGSKVEKALTEMMDQAIRKVQNRPLPRKKI